MLIANWIATTLFLVLALAVSVKKRKQSTDYFLLATIISFSCYLISDIWVNYSLNKWSFAFHSLASFAMFPPFFMYAMLLISKQHRIKKSWWWFMLYHFTYLIFVISDIFILNEYSKEDIENLYYSRIAKWPWMFYYKGLQLYTIAVMIWFISKLKTYQKKIENYYSNLEEIRLDWLKHFSWVYVLAYSTSFVAMFAFNIGLFDSIKTPYALISIATVLALLWMFYRGLKHHVLANFSEAEDKSSNSKKYSTSSLSQELATELYDRISELFEKEKIFHNPDLKVQDLASRLNATNHNISQVLNEIAGKSFYEFVNDYRIKYFKELLADPEKRRFTILALGMESGFNSKASINRVFKQQLGVTPREYQQQILAS